jgi:hypothetical protein
MSTLLWFLAGIWLGGAVGVFLMGLMIASDRGS